MAYRFYLDGVLLPVTPGGLRVKIKNQNRTVSLLNEGEANFLKLPGLSEVELEALLPQASYPFGNGGRKPADYYLSKLERLKTGKKPFQFIVSRATPGGKLLFDTNMKVSLEDYEILEDAKDLGMDVKVKISLKQYRDFGTKTVTLEQPQAEGEPAAAAVKQEREQTTAPEPKTYTVQKGDCLWNIAKKYCGDGTKWKDLAALNADKVVNPNLIYPGQTLTLP